MAAPRTIELIRQNAPLTDLQAVVGKLWLGAGRAPEDEGGLVAAQIAAYWQAKPGKDPFWDFLAPLGLCSECGTTYQYENLSICPGCLNTYCYRHSGQCDCGQKTLG